MNGEETKLIVIVKIELKTLFSHVVGQPEILQCLFGVGLAS